MAANVDLEEWRAPHFRQKVTTQIEEALRKSGNPQMMTRNAADIERDVFSKAKTRDEYMCFVARVLVFARDVGHGVHIQGRSQQQPGIVRVSALPGQSGQLPGQQVSQVPTQQGMSAIMRPQYSVAPQAGTVSNMTVAGGQYQVNQVQVNQVKHQMAVRNMATGGMVSQQQAQQLPQMSQMSQISQQLSQQMTPPQYAMAVTNQQQMFAVQQHPVTQQSLVTQLVHAPVQQAASVQQPHLSPQMPSPMPAQLGVQLHAVPSSVSQQIHIQTRMQHVQSPAMQTTMRAPTPAPHPSPAGQTTIAPSPACVPVPSPAPGMHNVMTPSPQQLVAASPAPSSVPTPGTLNVQSPASILNPGSVGPSVTSPAPLSAAEEQAYMEKVRAVLPTRSNDKHKQLSVYIDPLTRMINRMNRDKEHSTNDLKKLKNFLDILTNPTKRLTLSVLEKCEVVLKRMNLKPTARGTVVTTSPNTSTVTTAIPTRSYTIVSSEDVSQQINGQALLETVVKHLKSPLFPHTLKRTFTPILQAMEGPPICPLPPPYKKLRLTDENTRKCPLPHVLQGELARLCSRFTVKPDMASATRQNATLLRCSINDRHLPAVPPIEITVPQNYPMASPACKTNAYDSTPFLVKIRSQLSSELRRMPGFYTVTALLGAWESSIRQACMSDIEVK